MVKIVTHSGAIIGNPTNLQTFMPVLDTCKFDRDPIKNDLEKVETPFSP